MIPLITVVVKYTGSTVLLQGIQIVLQNTGSAVCKDLVITFYEKFNFTNLTCKIEHTLHSSRQSVDLLPLHTDHQIHTIVR